MTRSKICFICQRDTTLFFQHTQSCNRVGHDRGLGIFGEGQLIFRTFAHKLEQILAKRIINFLKHRARRCACVRKGLPHANGLAALPRKNKCAHDVS